MPRQERRHKEESIADVAGLLGIIASSLGYFFAGFIEHGEIRPDFILKALGVALFLGGVFVSIRLLIKKVDFLTKDMEGSFERLKDEHTVLRTYRDILDLGFLLDTDDSTVHVRAASQTLRQVVSDHVPKSTESLKKFQAGVPQATIEIKDHSPIFDLMQRLAISLPSGSVWLGVTHLTNVAAWLNPSDQAFKLYQQFARERSVASELSVLRLFCFRAEDERKVAPMRVVMADEVRAEISVRYVVGKQLPPDMSLLYLPPIGVKKSQGITLNRITSPGDLSGKGYRPLCVLSYTLLAGQYVQTLSIHAGSSHWFRDMEDQFKRSWNRAEEFSLSPQVEQAPNPSVAADI